MAQASSPSASSKRIETLGGITMKTFAVLTIGISVAALASCSSEALPPERGPEEEIQTGVSELELSALVAPEPGAAAADYEASTSRYRLFGVQISQVPAESFATLAETSAWTVRNLRVGELLGRNMRVAAITPAGLQLTGDRGTWVIPVGQEARLRVIRHRFDKAAIHQGRHGWRVDGGAVAQISGRYGMGAQAEPVEVFGRPALRLVHLQEEGVLARLGFREGDLLFRMNGQQLAPGDLGAFAARMAEPGAKVRLEVFREASIQELTFSVEEP
jgi:hypothetical protein